MKKTLLKTINVLLFTAAIAGCGSSGKKTDKPADENKTTTETKSETKTVGGANQSGTAGATVALVKAMVQKDWKAVDGQEVTVTAYPVGTAKEGKNGEFYLYMDDAPGGSSMNFACSFKEEMRAEVRTHKGDALMTITGNISSPNGIIALKNAKIVQ